MSKFVKFAIFAVAVLFVLSGCGKAESEFDLGSVVLLIQEDDQETGDFKYNFALGMVGANEEIEPGSEFITIDGYPVAGVSNIPNTYEKKTEYKSDPTYFNGEYFLSAMSNKGNFDSFSLSINFANSPLAPFVVEDYKYEGGMISAKFKEIDPNAILYGFHIVPVYKDLPVTSELYATDKMENLTLGTSSSTISIAFEMSPYYDRVNIYAAIVKLNSNNRVYHMYVKEMGNIYNINN